MRFDGFIAGLGTESGFRIVIGHWLGSPFGPVSDVMLESPSGHRTLLAPGDGLADLIVATYDFDEVRLGPVRVDRQRDRWHVGAASLDVTFTVGRRDLLGWILRALPTGLSRQPAWAASIDVIARVLMPGVRTAGTTKNGSRQWYAAMDLHRITATSARFDGTDLGPLRPVDPPVRFGFGSTPRRPSLARISSIIETGG